MICCHAQNKLTYVDAKGFVTLLINPLIFVCSVFQELMNWSRCS